MIASRILQEQLFTIVENGEMYLGIPHRLVGVIDHELIAIDGIGAVSYTHLTLPTIATV